MEMRYTGLALSALLAALHISEAAAGNKSYRCTDETGLTLLTTDARAADICKHMSMAARQCAGNSCPLKITKDQNGHLYLSGTVNGTRVTYPVEKSAGTSTICIRDQCKTQ